MQHSLSSHHKEIKNISLIICFIVKLLATIISSLKYLNLGKVYDNFMVNEQNGSIY